MTKTDIGPRQTWAGALAAVVLTGCAGVTDAAPEVLRTPEARFAAIDDFPYPPRYATVYRDGTPLRMHYIDAGPRNAPVILCLHGQGQWSYAYRDMLPIFVAAGYRVIAPDFIGFGRSDKLARDADYEFADHVAWLTNFIEDMSLGDDVTAFLFDWGGYFGLRIAGEHPELFGRLVLANTTLPRGDSGGSQFFKRWREGILARPAFPMGDMVAEGALAPLSIHRTGRR